MEVLNFQVERLIISKPFYEFEDCQVRIDDNTVFTFEGCVYPEFQKLDESGESDEDKISYYVDAVLVEIRKIWNEEAVEISLNTEELNQVKSYIEESLRSKEVENA